MEYLKEYSYSTYEQFDKFCQYMYIVHSPHARMHEEGAVERGICNFYIKGDKKEVVKKLSLISRWKLYDKACQQWVDSQAELWYSLQVYLENAHEVDLVLGKLDDAAHEIVRRNKVPCFGYSSHLLQLNNFPHIHLLYRCSQKEYMDSVFSFIVNYVELNPNTILINDLRDFSNNAKSLSDKGLIRKLDKKVQLKNI